ncbi:MAG: recombination protein RecR [Acholeplasmatales bacterium]|nr:recombination protein RecR [Acholeplasmatales bacterium]
MKKYPSALENLIESFSKLPGVGRKTAERYALYTFTKMPEEDITDFSNALISMHKDISVCPCCGNITESGLCSICSDETRKHDQILVVESIKDLYKIESVGEYNGIYHVLNGVISFSKGIGIDDLNIDSLIEKVKNGEISEVILATNATLEGETTARYIRELLNEYNIKVTRLAHGLPVGGDLSYSDEMTILKAFEGRTEY